MTRLPLLLALCALSCASLPSYTQPGADYAADRWQCEREVAQVLPRTVYAQGITIDLRRHNAKLSALDLCLRAKGWQREGG